MKVPSWGQPCILRLALLLVRETLENPTTLRENGRVIAGVNGDFQGRCHSLAATQAAWTKASARIGSGSSGGLLIHTSSG